MVEVLVGMIASGKSTYAKRRAGEGAIIINDDAIVTMCHGGRYELYSKECKPIYKGVENSLFALAVLAKKDVVIDRGVNIRAQSRQRFIALAKSFDLSVDAVVFPKTAAAVHAQRRFDSDNRGLSLEKWRATALAHEREYEAPHLDEGYRALRIVREPSLVEQFWQQLSERFGISLDGYEPQSREVITEIVQNALSSDPNPYTALASAERAFAVWCGLVATDRLPVRPADLESYGYDVMARWALGRV